MSLHAFCKPRPSVFSTDWRATVLNLDAFLHEQVDGPAFFEENFFTAGMLTLVDRAFRHLSGDGAGSSVMLLSQAMGGGKTHSMIALGLLARDPALREKILGPRSPASGLGPVRVVGFNGRNTDAAGGIWGSLAGQLGKAKQFTQYVAPTPAAPGPDAWKQLLGDEPLIVFLDELPPYLEYAVAVPVGNADLSVVTTAALANVFVAVADMSNVCLILSDLAGTNFSAGQSRLDSAFDRAVRGISAESKRIAVPIAPIDPNGDELYQILRKRLFEELAPQPEIQRVASAYREALSEAVSMGLTTTSPEALYARIVDSYPFHPDLRSLFARFKDNEGFQQTRGAIRLMQMVVAHLWNTERAAGIELIHPHELDLNVDEIASEVRAINPGLSEAMAHDVAHQGNAAAEEIDAAHGNADASDAARLIFIASLGTKPDATHGLREHELVDCLQRPGRDLSAFKAAVLDKLAFHARYLHQSADGRWSFTNRQNLAAKLRSTAMSLHPETVEQTLRQHLTMCLAPSLRDCYQTVRVLPPPDEVQLDQEKTTLVVARPGAQADLPPISADWRNWWAGQQYKNRVLFLSGSRDTFQRVLDAARQARAVEIIEDQLRQESTSVGDPQWRALDALRGRIDRQFGATLKEAFDQIVYPSINAALRAAATDLPFDGSGSAEAALRSTLQASQKFTIKIDDDSFRARAEARLFGGADSKIVLWSDLKRAAAVNTHWPLHGLSALDDLKAECLRRGLWREEGAHLRRGPFPPAKPEVSLRELPVQDDENGYTYLRIEPLHATALVYETGDADPTSASSPVPTPARFEATALRYRFLAYDPADTSRVSAIREWTAKLRLEHRLHARGDAFDLELRASPRANDIEIRYTTDGSAPANSGSAVYDGVVRVPEHCRVVRAIALCSRYGLSSEVLPIMIPRPNDVRPAIDIDRPVRWTHITKLDDAGEVWDTLRRLEAANGIMLHDITFTAESMDGQQNVEFSGTQTDGYASIAAQSIATQLQSIVSGGGLRMSIGSLSFRTGQALLDWLSATGQPFDASKIIQ